MKKLITGAVASLALLFGFASCSGDLHDNDVQPLGIVGLTNDAGNHVIPMTLDNADGSEQSLKITFKDGFELIGADGKTYKLTDDFANSWRSGNGNGALTASRFKVIPPSAIGSDGAPTWSDDYGSLNGDEPQYLTAGADYSKIGRRGDKGVSGDPKHIVFDGVIAGETYTLRAKYNAVSGSLELKLDGKSSDSAEIRLTAGNDSKNFPAKDEAGKDVTYKMEKAGSAYTYTFIAKADETLNLSFENDLAGTLSEDLSLTTVKNVEYKITVDVSEGISKPTIKYEVVDMLKDATVKANWKYAENFYSDASSTKINKDSLIFKAERTDIAFYIERAAGGVFSTDSVPTIKPGDSAISLKYVTDVNKAIPVKISDLKIGSYYQITLKSDSGTCSLSASIELLPPVDVTGMYLMIWFNTDSDWSNSKFVPLEKDGTYAWHVEVSPDTTKTVGEVRFDLCNANSDGSQDWSKRYGIKTASGKIDFGEKSGPFIPSEPDKRDYFEGRKDKTYRLDFNGEGGLWVTVTEK